jgi:hypothetical protein
MNNDVMVEVQLVRLTQGSCLFHQVNNYEHNLMLHPRLSSYQAQVQDQNSQFGQQNLLSQFAQSTA